MSAQLGTRPRSPRFGGSLGPSPSTEYVTFSESESEVIREESSDDEGDQETSLSREEQRDERDERPTPTPSPEEEDEMDPSYEPSMSRPKPADKPATKPAKGPGVGRKFCPHKNCRAKIASNSIWCPVCHKQVSNGGRNPVRPPNTEERPYRELDATEVEKIIGRPLDGTGEGKETLGTKNEFSWQDFQEENKEEYAFQKELGPKLKDGLAGLESSKKIVQKFVYGRCNLPSTRLIVLQGILRTDEGGTGEKLLLSEAGLFQTECFKMLLNWLKESIKGEQITVARDTLKVLSLLTRKAETHFCDMPTKETTKWLNRLTRSKGYLEKLEGHPNPSIGPFATKLLEARAHLANLHKVRKRYAAAAPEKAPMAPRAAGRSPKGKAKVTPDLQSPPEPESPARPVESTPKKRKRKNQSPKKSTKAATRENQPKKGRKKSKQRELVMSEDDEPVAPAAAVAEDVTNPAAPKPPQDETEFKVPKDFKNSTGFLPRDKNVMRNSVLKLPQNNLKNLKPPSKLTKYKALHDQDVRVSKPAPKSAFRADIKKGLENEKRRKEAPFPPRKHERKNPRKEQSRRQNWEPPAFEADIEPPAFDNDYGHEEYRDRRPHHHQQHQQHQHRNQHHRSHANHHQGYPHQPRHRMHHRDPPYRPNPREGPRRDREMAREPPPQAPQAAPPPPPRPRVAWDPPLLLHLEEQWPPAEDVNGQPLPGNYAEYEKRLKHDPDQNMRISARSVQLFRISDGVQDCKLALTDDGDYPEWYVPEDPSFNLVRPPF